jgi:peptide deformylase
VSAGPPESFEDREARRQGALAHIRQWGDPVLKMTARPVETFDAALATQAARMTELMLGAMGSGLAATQVGILQRMFVYRPGAGPDAMAVVNPQIQWTADEVEPDVEGCLSLQGVAVVVERPVAVRMQACTLSGETLVLEAEGHEARILQHELDHLDGVLMLERTTRELKKQALKALRERRAMPVPELPGPRAPRPGG